VTVVNVNGQAVDPRVDAFFANETAQYELTATVLDTWNNALAAEFATDPAPAPDASTSDQDGPPDSQEDTTETQTVPPPVVLEAATTVTPGGPEPAHSSPRTADSSTSSKAASPVSTPATADSAPSATPASSPAPQAGAPLLAVSEHNLSKEDQLEYDTLLAMAFELQPLTGAEAGKAQTAFLDRSDIFLKAHPDERALWLLRARLALHANLAPVGIAAGVNLQRLAAFDDPKLHGLMVAMNVHKWLPPAAAQH
jgi:hypothetical protein